MGARILLAEDDTGLRRVVEYDLQQRGYTISSAASGEEAASRLDDAWDLLITDVRLGDMSGLDLLAATKARSPDTAVVVVTAHATVQDAVRAMKLGADDYLTKPFDLEALAVAVERALRYRAMESENRRLRAELTDRFSFEHIIGVSPKMQEIFATLRKVAPSEATVLITGETGTGKELIARALHHNSPRASRPLVTVNCAAIPESLLESELFGHVKGSFTGAIRNKQGKFEAADGGTIFLDEIGDLGGPLQAKLLRVLQDGEIEMVGATETRRVDVRVIAATNRDLEKAVHEHAFRDDLFYRLAVVPIVLPPLRDRTEDFPLLVGHLLRKHVKGPEPRVTPESVELLRSYSWPGNVRELENICERIAIFLTGDTVTADDIPESIRRRTGPDSVFAIDLPPDGASLEEIEKAVIVQALERTGGNRSRAARYLRIPRHILLYRMQKFSIEGK